MQQPPNQQPYTNYQQQPPQFAPQGQYGSFSGQPAPMPPPKKGPRSWFSRQRKRTKIGLGCSALLFLLFLCIICSVAASAGSSTTTHQEASTQALATATVALNPTATTVPTHAIATPKPTRHVAAAPTRTPQPTPTKYIAPTPTPTKYIAPTPTPTRAHTGVNGNPWGYDFNPGNKISSPASAFCNYFKCVSTFWTATSGYVVECSNGDYSHSGGVKGACSRDGGVAATLYSH